MLLDSNILIYASKAKRNTADFKWIVGLQLVNPFA